jgi:hypothetical protein
MMGRRAILEDLELIERQIRFGVQLLQRQNQLLASLARGGFDSEVDQRLLCQLEDLQAHHLIKRKFILAQLGENSEPSLVALQSGPL